MSSFLQAVMVIPMVFILFLLIFLINTLENTMDFAENSVGRTGFHDIQPLTKTSHYHLNGTYTTSFKTISKAPITIKELILKDKIDDEECRIEKIDSKQNLKYWETFNITARCPIKRLQDLYTITAYITYTVNNTEDDSEETKQEIGDIVGNVER